MLSESEALEICDRCRTLLGKRAPSQLLRFLSQYATISFNAEPSTPLAQVLEKICTKIAQLDATSTSNEVRSIGKDLAVVLQDYSPGLEETPTTFRRINAASSPIERNKNKPPGPRAVPAALRASHPGEPEALIVLLAFNKLGVQPSKTSQEILRRHVDPSYFMAKKERQAFKNKKLAKRAANVVEDKVTSKGRTPGATKDKNVVSIETVIDRAAKHGLEELTAIELETLESSAAAARARQQPAPENGPQRGQVISTKPLANFLKHHSIPNAEGIKSIVMVTRLFGEAARMIASKNELTTAFKSWEWKVVEDIASLGKDLMKAKEAKDRFNEACQAIGELKKLEKVTAKDLTLYFAKKHKAAKVHLKRSEGEVLPDEKKRELVELVDAFQAMGGVVKCEGIPCHVGLNKSKNMKQFRFFVRAQANEKGVRKNLWPSIKVPKLVFSQT